MVAEGLAAVATEEGLDENHCSFPGNQQQGCEVFGQRQHRSTSKTIRTDCNVWGMAAAAEEGVVEVVAEANAAGTPSQQLRRCLDSHRNHLQTLNCTQGAIEREDITAYECKKPVVTVEM